MPLIPPPEAAFLLDPCASRVEGAAGQVIRMSRLAEKFNLMKLPLRAGAMLVLLQSVNSKGGLR
jgi:hypothetical protein